MKDNFSISTVAYSGYSMEQALDSIHSLGVYNIELALIQGAVYDLDEESVSEANVRYIRNLLNQRNMRCTSLAAHCHMTLENCNELLLKRVNLANLLDCPRLILYAPRNGNMSQFQHAASKAIARAEELRIQILIENVGDQQPYMLNDSRDFNPVLNDYFSEVMGINFDPGNLASHRPENDLLYDTVQSLDVAEHIHIKDLVLDGDSYEFCAIGDGICQYPELFEHVSRYKKMPFFSIEAPFALIRKTDGRAMLKPKQEILPLDEINSRLKASVEMIMESQSCRKKTLKC
ncbi:sugar phosphate isomerase/epimerase [Vibrio sp. JC009]|uniref:sugar phosphate isomerase/epimerase family protein n=1 Tax=Vibrio sp. JC009 TaxID=2912314 RepID=UPI0023AF5055|nr:TIM barrel protein [Vibrio sp. JC009]WED24763.1 sugar phosphate isomerase/epimerase [Vibrio sp. JC009]